VVVAEVEKEAILVSNILSGDIKSFEILMDMYMNHDDPIQNIHINLKKGQNHLSGELKHNKVC
jgi:hypothetical protein